jgi:hypothetical protein
MFFIITSRIRRSDHVTPLYPQKLALTSPTSGGRPVGIVPSLTKPTELLVIITSIISRKFPVNGPIEAVETRRVRFINN